jgi:hypothetical protein
MSTITKSLFAVVHLCENNVEHISAVLGENSSVMCTLIAAQVEYALEICFLLSLFT